MDNDTTSSLKSETSKPIIHNGTSSLKSETSKPIIHNGTSSLKSETSKPEIRSTADGGLLIHVPMLMRKRFGRKLIIAPEGLDGSSTGDHPASQERLVAILARAHAWTRLLDEGKYGSTKQLADALGKDPSYVASCGSPPSRRISRRPSSMAVNPTGFPT